MPLSRRAGFVVLLLAVFAANGSLAPCAGWQASLNAHMACCAGAAHACSKAQADDCCAAGEQRQHSETIASAVQALTASPLTIPGFARPLAAVLSPGTISREHWPPGTRPDTHLLLSVFLI